MRAVVSWAVRNAPGMNTLMLTILLVGAASLGMLRREVFPEFELDVILIRVPYPGASPSEVEEGICLKIEEAVRSIDGIKNQTTVAAEGMGSVVLELDADVADPEKVLNEVRSEVDRIPSFPENAEDPEVKEITFRQSAIQLAVIAPETSDPDAERKLREVAERIRDDLLQLDSVSQVNLAGVRDYQIDIEISEATLRRYGLTLQQVGDIVRRENLELPGGKLNSPSQQILLRGKNKRLTGAEIAEIPVVTQPDGVVLTVGDLGTVRDGFADTTAVSDISIPELGISQRPAMIISVDRTSNEDLLAITDEVHEFVQSTAMPVGYKLYPWRDESVNVRDRMNLLTRNGLQGLLLVFIVLAIFLDLRLAFWVALGIPISILGAAAVLLYAGQTLNMLSMFAFLMALGIVVDDAIVIGENIFAQRERGKSLKQAAIDGTVEVFPSVSASVATTIVAFAPLLFVAGIMGKFIAIMPVAVIAMLLISLVESLIILPCHLAHRGGWVFTALEFVLYPLHWLSGVNNRLLETIISKLYVPGLRGCLQFPAITLAAAMAILMVAVGLVAAGVTPFVVFPKLDSNIIEAKIVFPDGTPESVTNSATQRIEEAIREVNDRYADSSGDLLRVVHRSIGEIQSGAGARAATTSGSHVGAVTVELVDTAQRPYKSDFILEKWREAAGTFAGAESVKFAAPAMGPGGVPIEFKLLAPSENFEELEAAVEATKAKLASYDGVFDVSDDSTPGKWEYQLKIKDRARTMGIPLAELAQTVRAAYYGEETMRLQRGRHEVKLMVRYPPEERRSLAAFSEIRVRTGDGAERPLTELADVQVGRSASEINRVDQQRAITISADVDEAVGNARNIVQDLKQTFVPELLQTFPDVNVRWEGQEERTQESIASLFQGFAVAILVMYFLLTIEFRSYAQPLVVMAIIPFGIIGAIIGHTLLGLPLTLFSIFGLVALTGVVVNDSIVLIDFINHRLDDGLPLKEALVEAGARRFRPVLLTSLTTVAGMTPILMEKSFQAQILIPMAASICFGLILATVLVLFLAPTLYYIYYALVTRLRAENAETLETVSPEHSGSSRPAADSPVPEPTYAAAGPE